MWATQVINWHPVSNCPPAFTTPALKMVEHFYRYFMPNPSLNRSAVMIFIHCSASRVVEPHLLGYDSDNDLTLSAWQLSRGSGQGFRDFHVSKISGVTTTGKNFAGARPRYNQNGTTMSRVLCRL
jgi:hypothetical protein